MFVAGARQQTMLPRVTLFEWKVTEALTQCVVFGDQPLPVINNEGF